MKVDSLVYEVYNALKTTMHFKDNWYSELVKAWTKWKCDELLILDGIEEPELPIREMCSKLKIISDKKWDV
jgi:hypothetical protein